MAKVRLSGMSLDPVTEGQLVEIVLDRLQCAKGGWLLTANLDILRIYNQDPAARAVYELPDLVVADGMPLVWAARVSGQSLPERVAGSSLAAVLLGHCASQGHAVRLLGGAAQTAERASNRLRLTHSGLDVRGDSSLRFGAVPTTEEIALALPLLETEKSALVLVGLGSPKQEAVIGRLREVAPQHFYVGVGGTFSFLAGEVRRAPELLQRVGLEWLHRLRQEPRRLARRYLLQDLPFAGRVLYDAVRHRVSEKRREV